MRWSLRRGVATAATGASLGLALCGVLAIFPAFGTWAQATTGPATVSPQDSPVGAWKATSSAGVLDLWFEFKPGGVLLVSTGAESHAKYRLRGSQLRIDDPSNGPSLLSVRFEADGLVLTETAARGRKPPQTIHLVRLGSPKAAHSLLGLWRVTDPSQNFIPTPAGGTSTIFFEADGTVTFRGVLGTETQHWDPVLRTLDLFDMPGVHYQRLGDRLCLRFTEGERKSLLYERDPMSAAGEAPASPAPRTLVEPKAGGRVAGSSAQPPGLEGKC